MNTNKSKIFYGLLWLILAFSATPSVFAQNPKPPVINLPKSVETHRLNSKLMAREISYRVILPEGYAIAKGKTTVKPLSYPVIYLLHGLMGHFDNWTEKTKIAEYAARYDYIIVMPEGGDGWYTDSASQPNDRYESYIVDELIPEIDKKFRTIPDKKHRAIAGLSMGGYGSIKFGLKHPEVFALVGSFSGALAVTAFTDKEIKGAFLESILSIFGNPGSPTRKENDIFEIVRQMPSEKIKDLPFIYLDCGTEDFLFKSNREFSDLLQQKKIPHEYRELPGKHDWVYWDAQVQEFLEISEKYLK